MPSIEYQKVMSEIVFINLPAPVEPLPNMTGPEILHGFLAEFYNTNNEEVKKFTRDMCLKWNIHFKVQQGTKK